MSWKTKSQKNFSKLVQLARRFFYYLLSQNSYESTNLKCNHPILAMGDGKIILQHNVNIGFLYSPGFFNSVCYLEARYKSSLIQIGANTHINNGFTAIAENKSIIIGSKCLVGPNVNILNSDFHPVHPESRRNKEPVISEDIIIGDNVFIGANVTILKGVKIGSGATIAAGSIVCNDVRQDTLVGGNPAQVLKLFRPN